MGVQNKTGIITEGWVKDEILKLGLIVNKPIPDRGVDFVVTSSNRPDKKLKVQVKGRGETQKNKRYRWFQVRTTKNQRAEALEDGLSKSEAWKKKIAKADIYIFVSQRFREFWIFELNDIENIIQINRIKHGNRKDNQDGSQVELDLDLEYKGVPITVIYHKNLNNWNLVLNYFS